MTQEEKVALWTDRINAWQMMPCPAPEQNRLRRAGGRRAEGSGQKNQKRLTTKNAKGHEGD